MATGLLEKPEQKAQAKSELESSRAKAAMEQSRLTTPVSQQSSRPSSGVEGSERSRRIQDQRASLANQQSETRGSRSPGAIASRLRSVRKGAQEEQAERKKRAEEARIKDYPNPIRVTNFVVWAPFALAQDLAPLIGDIIGLGWLLNYAMLPLTWFTYWLLIIRYTPYSLRRKFWYRTLLVSAIGWIPFVGEIAPEWTATYIAAAYVIFNYERGRSSITSGVTGSVGVKSQPNPVNEAA